MIKNWLILTGIFIEMGVIEIEYEPNKIKVFTKIDEEPLLTRIFIHPNRIARVRFIILFFCKFVALKYLQYVKFRKISRSLESL